MLLFTNFKRIKKALILLCSVLCFSLFPLIIYFNEWTMLYISDIIYLNLMKNNFNTLISNHTKYPTIRSIWFINNNELSMNQQLVRFTENPIDSLDLYSIYYKNALEQFGISEKNIFELRDQIDDLNLRAIYFFENYIVFIPYDRKYLILKGIIYSNKPNVTISYFKELNFFKFRKIDDHWYWSYIHSNTL